MASERMNINTLSDETFDLLCTVCKGKGKYIEAERYCIECSDFYCLTCVKVHEDVPLLSGHKIVDKRQFPSVSHQQLPQVPTERCDRHSHKHVDMYCQNHDDVGCSTCMAIEHRSCKDIFFIPEFIQHNRSLPASRDIQQNLESAAKSLNEQLDRFQHEKQRLLEMKAESLEEIRKFREEINARLDQLEQKSVAEIEEKLQTLITEIEGNMGMIQTNRASVGSAKNKLASASNNVSQEFVNAKKGSNVVRDARKSIEKSKSCFQRQDIDFTRDQNIQTLLKEMNVLGKVLLRDALLLTKVKTTYNVNVASDKGECNIVSVCVLEDGTIILSDTSNMRLKRLHRSTYTVTDFLDFPHNPWDVCPIDNQQVAVSLQGLKEIHFISVGIKMTKIKQIKLDFGCYGMANANDKLLISDSKTSVYMYSLFGKKLKQFIADKLGQRLFSDIRSIAVSEDGSKIYVTDGNNGLIILDDNGQLIGTFDGQEFKKPASCYRTSTGNVIVAAAGSNNVLQFGPSGKLIGEVLSFDGGNRRCQAVACDQQMSKLIVGRYTDNNIEVYDVL